VGLKNIVRKTLTMLSENYDYLNSQIFISSLKKSKKVEKIVINISKISITDSVSKFPLPPAPIKKAPILYELELISTHGIFAY